MTVVNSNCTADLFFQLSWSSALARHTDTYAGSAVNFWRDLLPGRLLSALEGRQAGDRFSLAFAAGELFSEKQSDPLITLATKQFEPARMNLPDLAPAFGRFYPKGLLADVSGIFSANRAPFRCVGVNNGTIKADMAHPMSAKPISLSVTVGAVALKHEERGGSATDWMETVCQGVGMQARWMDRPTEFFAGRPLARDNEAPDSRFYAKPRLVNHLDDTALDIVSQIYGRFIRNEMRVLDLMSSWRSHLPSILRLKQLVGIGLNEVELRKNPALSDYRVQDLNREIALDFADNHFDAAICTASVEYLTNPDAVFSEVARTLRPGAPLVVTFSNRWFEPKAVQVWKELHEFERMGLVLEYFARTGQFDRLGTYSSRGLRRPSQDKYFGRIPQADPVYAVWGRKA